MTLDEFFLGWDDSRRIFDTLQAAIEAAGDSEINVTKSQVAFKRRRGFAWAWVPGFYLKGKQAAPLVLSLAFSLRDPSPRWKEIVEPYPGRFMHHLELWSEAEIDDEVRSWIRRAWAFAEKRD